MIETWFNKKSESISECCEGFRRLNKKEIKHLSDVHNSNWSHALSAKVKILILTQRCRDPLRSLVPHCPEESLESSQWKLVSLYLAPTLAKDINDELLQAMTVVKLCVVCVLPVSVTRLLCLCSMLFFSSLLSTGSSEDVSGRGSDLGSSGESAELLKPFSILVSFGTSIEDLQGRCPIGRPLRPMHLQTGVYRDILLFQPEQHICVKASLTITFDFSNNISPPHKTWSHTLPKSLPGWCPWFRHVLHESLTFTNKNHNSLEIYM